MHTLLLLLTVSTTLVLRSGDRIAVDGPVTEKNGVITFRAAGTMYSMKLADIERIEKSEGPSAKPDATAPAAKAASATGPVKKLAATEEQKKKLLTDLEKNHSGTPAPRQPSLETPPPPPTKAEVAEKERDEWAWRRDARAHEEAVRRAKEELQLLQTRIEKLQSEILSFVSLGYKPNQFTYQSTELVRTKERIPYAELEVERAQRAHDQFREDARRLGILPGWLR
jgi:hypothetical protein